MRLCKRQDFFDHAFTPLDVLDQIMEREGEVSEWHGNSRVVGSFGLRYEAVKTLRENVLQFLDYLLYSERCAVAVRAVRSLGLVVVGNLVRYGGHVTDDEIAWQTSEQLKILAILDSTPP